MLATMNNHMDIVMNLLSSGASVDQINNVRNRHLQWLVCTCISTCMCKPNIYIAVVPLMHPPNQVDQSISEKMEVGLLTRTTY